MSRKPVRLFLRDDDVGALTPQFVRFAEIFASRGLPMSYQVIPAQLTDECAEHVADRRRIAPHLTEFSQHGYTHQMTIGGRVVHREFGPERTYDDQLQAIQAGRAILRAKLGEHFNPLVFTPPQHKYDRNTLAALQACGVEILSASSYTSPLARLTYLVAGALRWTSIGGRGISHHGRKRTDIPLMEASISIKVDDGSRRLATPSGILQAVERERRASSLIGLMFHHNVYQSADDADFLAETADLLVGIEDASFHLISNLWDCPHP